MTTLQLRKKTLLLESDLNRLTLHAECKLLHQTANWTGHLKDMRQQIAPWALILAPLAGVALALGLRRSAGGIGWFTRLLLMAPPLIRLYRAWGPPGNAS